MATEAKYQMSKDLQRVLKKVQQLPLEEKWVLMEALEEQIEEVDDPEMVAVINHSLQNDNSKGHMTLEEFQEHRAFLEASARAAARYIEEEAIDYTEQDLIQKF